MAEQDPENQEIVRLHREDRLNWSEIAEVMNERRVAAGKQPTFTGNAIYSRYQRNAPRIAAARGEFFDPDEVIIVSKKKAKALVPITGFDGKEDELLVQAHKEITEETWELISERIVAKGGRKHTADMCLRRYGIL